MTLSLLANVDSRYQNKELERTGLIFSFAFGFIVIKYRESENFGFMRLPGSILQTGRNGMGPVFKSSRTHD